MITKPVIALVAVVLSLCVSMVAIIHKMQVDHAREIQGYQVQIADLRRQLDAKETLQAKRVQESRAQDLKNLAQGFAGLISADPTPTQTAP